MSYLKIDCREWIEEYSYTFPLKLRVVQDDGVEVTPDDTVKVSNLKRGNGNNKLFKHFLNLGDGGIKFRVKLLIKRDDLWEQQLFNNTTQKYDLNYPHVTNVLRKFYTEMKVVTIVTDFIDVPNGDYIITKNPSRVQSFQDTTIWEIEFTTYRAVNTPRYKNNNSAVKSAIAKANKAKTTTTTTSKTTKSASTKNTKLSKCQLSQLKYTGNKQKVVTCVKYMQDVLYKKGYLTKKQVDGWYGPKTLAAVKKFQKKYKKQYNLKETGKMDKNTLNAMCKV